jgi:aryl-alcohol dehydrogenase-like predicted oxidoreductase
MNSAVPKRKLGTHGPRVSALGLGCMGMSQFYGPRDDAQSIRTLQAAMDAGVDFIDTADVYGMGHNETLIGQALRGRREAVVLATKFGARPEQKDFRVDGRPHYVREACSASLRRLGVDCIDLYYLHRLDAKVPIEETVGAMAQLVTEGKVRYLGLSEVGPATLQRACAVHPIAALQSEYSVWTRDPEDGVLAACRRLGIGFVAFSPLGRGFLAGQVKEASTLDADDRRRKFPRFQGEHLARNLRALEAFDRLARAKGCTTGQLALAWLLARGEDVVPIPGTRRVERLAENIGALQVKLNAEELARIDADCGPGAFSGERYQPADMALVAR